MPSWPTLGELEKTLKIPSRGGHIKNGAGLKRDGIYMAKGMPILFGIQIQSPLYPQSIDEC